MEGYRKDSEWIFRYEEQIRLVIIKKYHSEGCPILAAKRIAQFPLTVELGSRPIKNYFNKA